MFEVSCWALSNLNLKIQKVLIMNSLCFGCAQQSGKKNKTSVSGKSWTNINALPKKANISCLGSMPD
jgi:hypothetical protein